MRWSLLRLEVQEGCVLLGQLGQHRGDSSGVDNDAFSIVRASLDPAGVWETLASAARHTDRGSLRAIAGPTLRQRARHTDHRLHNVQSTVARMGAGDVG